MERVAFLIESTGERLGCLLNPDSLVVRRVAGLRSRSSASGPLTGAGLADDPLLFTGGGRTELTVDLLFDVNLAGSSITTEDVKDLTRPLWDLAENSSDDDPYGRPRLVRFVWGKSWNIPCVVAAVAERDEQFTPEGAPQRAWLRMRLLRVSDRPSPASAPPAPPQGSSTAPEELANLTIPDESVRVHVVLGGGEGEGGSESERLDALASRYYGQPSLWRLIAAFNGIDDPSHVPPDTLLRIPPLSALGAT